MKAKQVGKVEKLLLGAGLSVSALGVAAIAVPTAAYAQENCTYNSGGAIISCTTVSAEGGTPTPSVTPAVSASSSNLPFTGADIEQLAAIGGGAVLIGGLLVVRSRRRANAAVTGSSDGLVLAEKTVWSQWRSGSPTTRG